MGVLLRFDSRRLAPLLLLQPRGDQANPLSTYPQIHHPHHSCLPHRGHHGTHSELRRLVVEVQIHLQHLQQDSNFVMTPTRFGGYSYTPNHQGVYDDNLSNKGRPIEQFMLKMSEQVSLHDIDEAANWITQRLDLSEDVIPTNLDSEFLQRILDKYKEEEGTADVLIAKTSPLDPDFLLKLLQLDSGKVDTTNKDLTKKEVGEWMNVAHKQCFVYINKLHGRLGSAKILLKVLAVSQIVATIIFWLFITQLATTKLVLTLGSLFLGLTFIFGDTCKTFFQGVIFSFVAHPLDVGDLVEIEGIKLEVKKINILTTIFRKEHSDAILLYPNSAIFTTKITKLPDNNNTMTLSGFKRLVNDRRE
ncbi:hypothetical protein V2J09_011158 [Rumex salicifolius]